MRKRKKNKKQKLKGGKKASRLVAETSNGWRKNFVHTVVFLCPRLCLVCLCYGKCRLSVCFFVFFLIPKSEGREDETDLERKFFGAKRETLFFGFLLEGWRGGRVGA